MYQNDTGRISHINHVVVVGIGSNLGDRQRWISRACAMLARIPGTRLQARSITYETEPVGPPQPKFLNAAARLQTALCDEALLKELQDIERRLGRQRTELWGPRTIDLDILWSTAGSHDSPELQIPHPRLLERAFALAPLLDIAPEVRMSWGPRLASLGGRPTRWPNRQAG